MIDVQPYIDKLNFIPDWIEAFAECRIGDVKMLDSGNASNGNPVLFYWMIRSENIGIAHALATINYGHPLFKTFLKIKT